MPNEPVVELREVAQRLEEQAAVAKNVENELERLDEAVVHFRKSWSGSNMGYQSRVYYADFESPPPGAHFDSEWGFMGYFNGTTGDWREYDKDEVLARIYDVAAIDSLDREFALARTAHELWSVAQADVTSILSTYLAQHPDPLLEGLQKEVEAVRDLSSGEAARALVGRIGAKIIRDTTAFSQGFMAAPHQIAEGRLVAIRSSFAACGQLSNIAKRGAAHIERVEASQRSKGQERDVGGTNVFIGHGRSLLWRELKDFVSDRLGLPWDEFNRVPVAGMTNIARLSEMLDAAAIALLVLTAEDETKDGGERARQNVVHEAGLFQGRLGFSRAIVLLEDGCEEFSNIQGLGQIRFPQGQISAAFEEVRQVLEREGLLGSE